MIHLTPLTWFLVLITSSQRKASTEEVKINNSKNMGQDREHAWQITSVLAGEAQFDGLRHSIHVATSIAMTIFVSM